MAATWSSETTTPLPSRWGSYALGACVGAVPLGAGPPGPPGPLPKPCSVLVTVNDASTFTVTDEPSASLRCASYGEPSLSVSTRITVAPGYLASAAAVTFCAVVPVRSVSPGPGVMAAGSPAGGCAGAVAADDELELDGVVVELVAAPASDAAPRPTPAASAPVTSHFCMVF